MQRNSILTSLHIISSTIIIAFTLIFQIVLIPGISDRPDKIELILINFIIIYSFFAIIQISTITQLLRVIKDFEYHKYLRRSFIYTLFILLSFYALQGPIFYQVIVNNDVLGLSGLSIRNLINTVIATPFLYQQFSLIQYEKNYYNRLINSHLDQNRSNLENANSYL
jgi:hypothetical protein